MDDDLKTLLEWGLRVSMIGFTVLFCVWAIFFSK